MSSTYAPPPCPTCTTGKGRPTSVTVGHQQRTVAYRCDQCQHDWSVTTTDAERVFGVPVSVLSPPARGTGDARE